MAEQLELYRTERQGIYTMSTGSSAAFLPLQEISERSSELLNTLEDQDPSLSLAPGTNPQVLAGYSAQRATLINSIRQGWVAVSELLTVGGPGFAFSLMKPFSRGTININSLDPFADPTIDFGALRNPVDMEILVDSFKSWRKILTMPSFQVLEPIETLPGTNVTSDEDIKEYIRGIATAGLFHPVGTAAMLPKPLGGVVDPELLVYGVKKLSIVDASIIPIIPSSHTVSTAYAIAEKAADIIKARR